MREPTLEYKGGHVLLFGEHDLYRPPRGPAEQDGVGLYLPAHDLRAKPAADMGADAPDVKLPVENMERVTLSM